MNVNYELMKNKYGSFSQEEIDRLEDMTDKELKEAKNNIVDNFDKEYTLENEINCLQNTIYKMKNDLDAKKKELSQIKAIKNDMNNKVLRCCAQHAILNSYAKMRYENSGLSNYTRNTLKKAAKSRVNEKITYIIERCVPYLLQNDKDFNINKVKDYTYEELIIRTHLLHLQNIYRSISRWDSHYCGIVVASCGNGMYAYVSHLSYGHLPMFKLSDNCQLTHFTAFNYDSSFSLDTTTKDFKRENINCFDFKIKRGIGMDAYLKITPSLAE